RTAPRSIQAGSRLTRSWIGSCLIGWPCIRPRAQPNGIPARSRTCAAILATAGCKACAPADVAALYAALSKAGLAARTVKHVHVVLHRALGQAKVWALVKDNVSEMVKPPIAATEEAKILQPDQARELLARLRGHPLYLLASLGLASGMRRDEMLALR